MTARRSAPPPPTPATLAQVKALADPLRYRVFEGLVAEPRTAKQMAAQLGTHPTRLYHHFRVLERAGLIRPAGTRQTRGTTEKYFKAAVERIEAGARSAGVPGALASALFGGVLASALADVQQAGTATKAPGAASPRMYLKRYRLRATAGRAAEIQARLDAVAALCERESAGEGGREFRVTLAFYETPDAQTNRTPR